MAPDRLRPAATPRADEPAPGATVRGRTGLLDDAYFHHVPYVLELHRREPPEALGREAAAKLGDGDPNQVVAVPHLPTGSA
ncbi:hypothetical protein KYC5002_17585 [Archangium violaceum]|uniref:hypothetical protein n=1 Tax=Archangium violaceum TaxID=83451 RepID=UPI002B27FEDE|nr:hypothetical protein KYC5002_17585 [Archangium gephyra]